MNDGLGFVIAALLSAACVVALLVVIGAIFPLLIERTRRAAESMPGRSFLVGLINTLFLGAVFFAIQDLGALSQVIGVAILALYSLGLVVGLGALARLTAMRLFGLPVGLRSVGWASLLLVLASLTPFVGWFGLFPYLGLRGVGAFILGWWGGRKQAEAPPAPVP
jgi:hypothetical protein